MTHEKLEGNDMPLQVESTPGTNDPKLTSDGCTRPSDYWGGMTSIAEPRTMR